MYKIGDKVLYSNDGIFYVNDIVIKNYGAGDIKYICLKPFFVRPENKSLIIYVPESKQDDLMREVMSKNDALELIQKIKEIEPIWFADSKIRKEKFAELYKSNDIVNICLIVKSLYVQQKKLNADNKSLNLVDYDYLTKLKKGIEEEIAVAIDRPVLEIEKLISDSIS